MDCWNKNIKRRRHKCMKKTLKNALVTMLVTGLCLSLVGIATAEEPTFGDITLDPDEPTIQSDVTFTVDVTGTSIEEVSLFVMECVIQEDGTEFCHAAENISMTIVTGDTWGVTTTLVYDDTTISHCWLVIKDNGTWYSYQDDNSTWTDFTVVPGDDGNGDNGDGTNGGDNGTNGTPGFELILLVSSIVLALFIYKKKRIK